MNTARRGSSKVPMTQGTDSADFQRRHSIMAEKKEKSEHEKSQKEDEKIEQTLKRYAEENAQIVERSQKRKEERAKREKEFHERKLERQRRFEDEMAKIKSKEEKNREDIVASPLTPNGTLFSSPPPMFNGFDESDAVKSPTTEGNKRVGKKTKEEEEEEEDARYFEAREKALQNRMPNVHISAKMGKAKLSQLAAELHERLTSVEEEKYDLKIEVKKQKYELKEVSQRIEEIQKRKRFADKMDELEDYTSEDLLQDLIKADADSISLMPSTGTHASITTIGGVYGRLKQFHKMTKPKKEPTIERKVSEPGEISKRIQSKIEESGLVCCECEEKVFHVEAVQLRDKQFYHRECVYCNWCGKTVSPHDVGFHADQIYCPFHLKQAVFGATPPPRSPLKKKNGLVNGFHS
ncbi:troponin I-like [Symsagittifera roscoffensis]|uniref:troponin I-like n=1 Tax=Symsagittifera roscoffensis TaxID=84072 RepID=UPI00307B185B